MSRYFINPDVESPVRFDMQRFMEFTDNLDPLTSSFLEDIRALDPAGFFVIGGEEYRPDVISTKIYGSTQYWWVVMIYNDLTDVNKLISGVSIKYPAQADLEDLYFALKSKATAQGA